MTALALAALVAANLVQWLRAGVERAECRDDDCAECRRLGVRR